jgi:hypothetical protein
MGFLHEAAPPILTAVTILEAPDGSVRVLAAGTAYPAMEVWQSSSDPAGAGPEAKGGDIRPLKHARRPPTAGGQEQEPRTLLVRVAEQSTLGVRPLLRLDVVHPATLERSIGLCLTNPGNYN